MADPSNEGPEAEEALRHLGRVEALQGLYAAGHYEQVLTQGRLVLERDPQDEFAHYLLSLALIQLDRTQDAFLHIDALLTHQPNWSATHHAASLGFKKLRRYQDAWIHIQNAIRLEPTTATYHTLAAVLALQRHDWDQARESIATARRLDPNDPDVIRLAVEIQGINQTTARQAWERIRELEQGLMVDPNNPGLHASIGYIYLDELDQPHHAEQSFRDALLRDPGDKDNQKALFRAIGQQRLIYRLLSIPSRAFVWLGNWFRGASIQPWRYIFLVIAFKVVFAYLIWLVLVTVLFWPPAKFYQWLLISEIECVAESSERQLRFKRALNRRPFWLRFLACVGLVLAFWFALFATLGIVTTGFVVLAVFVGIHFVITLGLWLTGKARSSFGRRAAQRNV